jgi:hypothetical protein
MTRVARPSRWWTTRRTSTCSSRLNPRPARTRCAVFRPHPIGNPSLLRLLEHKPRQDRDPCKPRLTPAPGVPLATSRAKQSEPCFNPSCPVSPRGSRFRDDSASLMAVELCTHAMDSSREHRATPQALVQPSGTQEERRTTRPARMWTGRHTAAVVLTLVRGGAWLDRRRRRRQRRRQPPRPGAATSRRRTRLSSWTRTTRSSRRTTPEPKPRVRRGVAPARERRRRRRRRRRRIGACLQVRDDAHARGGEGGRCVRTNRTLRHGFNQACSPAPQPIACLNPALAVPLTRGVRVTWRPQRWRARRRRTRRSP